MVKSAAVTHNVVIPFKAEELPTVEEAFQEFLREVSKAVSLAEVNVAAGIVLMSFQGLAG